MIIKRGDGITDKISTNHFQQNSYQVVLENRLLMLKHKKWSNLISMVRFTGSTSMNHLILFVLMAKMVIFHPVVTVLFWKNHVIQVIWEFLEQNQRKEEVQNQGNTETRIKRNQIKTKMKIFPNWQYQICQNHHFVWLKTTKPLMSQKDQVLIIVTLKSHQKRLKMKLNMIWMKKILRGLIW